MSNSNKHNMLRALVRAVLLEEDSPSASGSVDPKAVPGLYRKRDGTYDYVFQPSDFKDIEFKIPDFSAVELDDSEQSLPKTVGPESAYEVLSDPQKYSVKKSDWTSDKRPGFTSQAVAHPRKMGPDGKPLMRRHLGMDISFIGAGLTEAMPALAVADGTATVKPASEAELEGAEGAGNVVEIELAGGIKVRYLHLANFAFTGSKSVKRGDKLGMLGQTGSRDSPHLHFEVYDNNVAVNPISYLTNSSKNWAFPAGVILP